MNYDLIFTKMNEKELSEEEKQIKAQEDTTGLPSLFKTWNQFYGFVFLFLVFQVIIYRLFTIYFGN